MNLGLLSVHASDELRSVLIPTNRIGRPTDRSNYLLPGHLIGEVTADRVSRTRSEQNYNDKIYFETRREGVVNQEFGRQNNYMSWPPLDLTPLGKNTTNRTMSPIDLIPIRTKMTEPTPLTRPANLPDQNGKAHVPGDLDLDLSLSESLSNKSNFSKDINSSVSNKKKRDKKKIFGNTRKTTCHTHCQAILICPKTLTIDRSGKKEEP